MPDWLQVVAKINPLSYMVDGLRALLVSGTVSSLPIDIGVLFVAVLLISAISTYMYPKVIT
jgi:ABC-2 type transport system permease protein